MEVSSVIDSAHWYNCDDEDCTTCKDRRERYEASAREHAIDRAIRKAQEREPYVNASLEEYE